MQTSTLLTLRALALSGTRPVCHTCHRRALSVPSRQQQEALPTMRKSQVAPSYQPSVAEEDLRKGDIKPLGRPLGFEEPPRPGDNSPKDDRTWQQRRDDFVDYDKHLLKRKAMRKKFNKGYYKDWAMLRFNQGKTFLANPKIFKADLSLYFPNVVGRTLAGPDNADTTPVLRGKVSVVTVFSSQWADNQIKTWIGPKDNPEVAKLVAESGGMAQHVYINVEDNAMKWWVLWLSQRNLRSTIPKQEHSNYFLVNYELPDVVRETLGLFNKVVGYVFLVDQDCRIRWAGSGEATVEEQESLVKGLRRLIELRAEVSQLKVKQPEVEADLEAQAVAAGAS